jgi:hypothetical protein
MTHLSLTSAEYRAVSRVHYRLDFNRIDFPGFQRILTVSLADTSPGLAGRISRLGQGEVRLLYAHFRAEVTGRRQVLTAEEWQKLGEACESVPSTHRFAYLIQRMVSGHLRATARDLYRKLSRVSITQFVRLFEKARSARQDKA